VGPLLGHPLSVPLGPPVDIDRGEHVVGHHPDVRAPPGGRVDPDDVVRVVRSAGP